MAQVEVVRCFGDFGSVNKWHEFVFRVYADGTLTADMERSVRRVWVKADDDEEKEEDNEEGDDDLYADEDDGWYEEDQSRHGVLSEIARINEERGDYDVKFTAVATWRPGDEEGGAMACNGRLSVANGLNGSFEFLDGSFDSNDGLDDDKAAPFLLQTRSDS